MKRPLVLCAVIAAVLASETPSDAQPKTKVTVTVAGETKFEIKRHIHCMAFSPDGKTLAVAEENVHLYDVSGETPKEIAVLKSRVGFGIRSIIFSPDGKKIAFGGADHTVRVWDVATTTELAHMKEHKGDVRSVAFSPDGKFLATGSNDKTIILWNVPEDGKLTENTVIKADDKFGSPVCSVVFAKQGKAQLLVSAGNNGIVRVFSVDKGAKQTSGLKFKGGFGDATVVSSPDSKMWALSDHKQVHMFTATGAAAGTVEGHKEVVSDLAFSADGKLLATVGRDGTLNVWGLGSNKPLVTKDRPGQFTSVTWAPAASGATEMSVAASLQDGTVWIVKLAYSK
jgi:WD40 repeat protein